MYKKFFEYLIFDPFFLTKNSISFFYKFFVERSLKNLFYKKKLDRILNIKKKNFHKRDVINEPISKNIKKKYNPEII